MFDFIRSHALKNVWCTPDQDNQVIVKPARITPINGVWSHHRVLWNTVKMPEPTGRFHLFQIGQIHPLLLNLFPQRGEWVTLAQACIAGENILDLYTTSGLQLPRTQTWYLVTKENNILLAVKQLPKIPYDFNEDELFLRVYSNEYYASSRSHALNDLVDVQGGVMSSAEDILALQAKYNARAAAPGGIYAFVNGYKAKDISLTTVKVGDVAEFVFDSAIIRVIDFKIDDMGTFDSVLDSKGKYLLHYTGDDSDTIDFLDDIDLFIVDADTQKGVYVHKNAGDTLRMLSHRDYAIPIAYVAAYLFHFIVPETGALVSENLYLRMHVRKSGYARPLILEHHRLNELYKLPNAALVRAMLGVHANVPVWHARELELSKYPLVMRSKCCDIDNAMVQEAYGYNAVAKLVADTPSVVQTYEGVKMVSEVPYLLQGDGTAFEYDANGLLLGYWLHGAGRTYVCRHADAHYVEILAGEGSLRVDDVYGAASAPLDSAVSYRFYTCPQVDGVPTYAWQDVTDTDAYAATETQAVWNVDPATTHTLVRSDKRFMLRSLELNAANGLLAFPLTQQRTVDGVTAERDMNLPMGELDVFLNGHSLIEGLDYFVSFPDIIIVNKRYLQNPSGQAQQIVVRHMGHCGADLSRTAKNEFGFVQHGKVSVNNRFDIHDGKVLRIVSGGRLQVRAELAFSEADHSYTMLNATNGDPYLIRDIVVPLKSLVRETTYSYRAKSLAVDKAISDYLSISLPEDAPVSVNPISQRYELYSPFVCNIMHDLLDGVIYDPVLTTTYSDMEVRRLCAPYEYLLAYDPMHSENALDADYVNVHPHFLTTMVDLNLVQYRFLEKVVRIYGGGRISLGLSSFVRMA